MTEVGVGCVIQGLEELAVSGDDDRTRVFSQGEKQRVVDDESPSSPFTPLGEAGGAVFSRKLSRRNGIPLLNYFGWFFLVSVVVLLYQHLTRTEEVENNQRARRRVDSERLSVVMLLSYNLVSAIWAIKQRKPRYLLYSVLFFATLVAALAHR